MTTKLQLNSPQQIDQHILNIQKYIHYINSTIKDTFTIDEIAIIENWQNTKIEVKNYYIYITLLGEIESSEKLQKKLSSVNYYQEILNISKIEPYNITISDIFVIFETYKEIFRNNERKNFFIYILKLLYSMLLLQTYLESKKTYLLNDPIKYKQPLHQYLLLLNSKLLPDVLFESRHTKMKVYINQEFLADEEIEPDTKNFINKFAYTRLNADGDILSSALQKHKSSSSSIQSEYSKYSVYTNTSTSTSDDYKGNFWINPLTYITKEDYLIDSFNNTNHYVFYSLFDLDIIARANFSNKATEPKFDTVLKRINDLASSGVKIYSKKRTLSFLYKRKDTSNCTIFPKELIDNSQTVYLNITINKSYSNPYLLNKDNISKAKADIIPIFDKIVSFKEISKKYIDPDDLKYIANEHNRMKKNRTQLTHNNREFLAEKADVINRCLDEIDRISPKTI